MKKLLLSSMVLLMFSASIIILQMSCQKEVSAQQQGSNYVLPPATTNTLGGVIVGNGLTITANGTISVTSTSGGLTQLNKIVYKRWNGTTTEIWITNYDGTGNNKVNIALPAGIVLSDDLNPILSPNGQKLFFTAGTSALYADLYSCNVDGSGVTKIVDKGSANSNIILGAAY